MDIVNHDVRSAIADAERQAARSHQPAQAFTERLRDRILGQEGLRNRYLDQADSARGTFDPSAPITSKEQSSLLDTGRFTLDRAHGAGDGDSSFKDRKDP